MGGVLTHADQALCAILVTAMTILCICQGTISAPGQTRLIPHIITMHLLIQVKFWQCNRCFAAARLSALKL